MKTNADLVRENRKLRKLLFQAVQDREMELEKYKTQVHIFDRMKLNLPEYKLLIDNSGLGYGALMSAAAVIWGNSLKSMYGSDSGIFLSSICKGSIEHWLKQVKEVLAINNKESCPHAEDKKDCIFKCN